MEHDDLFTTLFPASGEEPTPEAQKEALQSLLIEIAPQEVERGLDLAGLLGLSKPATKPEEAGTATRGLDLKELLTQPNVLSRLVKLLMDKFKLPKGLADLLAQGMLKDLGKKKPARKRKTSSSTSKPKPKTTKRRRKTAASTAKPKTSAAKPKKKPTRTTAIT